LTYSMPSKDQCLKAFFIVLPEPSNRQITLSASGFPWVLGVATFKNGKIDQFLAQIPMKHIVLETDSPYLAPVPFRGKRNESSYLYHIAQRVAGIYDCPLTEVDQVTTANAHALFTS
jgi:Tat protein secretion system quality control protein TatD with DNase activity